MARTFHVYPKAKLIGSSWQLIVKVSEVGGNDDRFVHLVPAGVTAEVDLLELKISFDLVVTDTDIPQDVDDALFVDDIKPGGGVETVWGNWQGRAEAIIGSLATGYARNDYWVAWSQQETAKTRADARRALITQRGWSIPHIHWHEGDGTNGDVVA